VSLCPWERHL